MPGGRAPLRAVTADATRDAGAAGCPAADSLAQQKGEDLAADADRRGSRVIGPLAGLAQRGEQRLGVLGQLGLAVPADRAGELGDLPDAGTVLVRDGLRLARLSLGRVDQHQGLQLLLQPQLLLGMAAAVGAVLGVLHPVLGGVERLDSLEEGQHLLDLLLQVQDEGDRHVAQDGLGTDDDIGAGGAVASVLGRGQVENGRERPGVFPQGFLGVNAFRNELRSEWLPAPAVKTLAETGAPTWAVEAFDRLRAANGGSLGGFCDVFAWREPGEISFYEAKVGPDRIKPTQLRFIELALHFRRPEQFMIVEVAGPSLRSAPGHMPRSAVEAIERDMPRSMPDRLRSNRQRLLRLAARDLLGELDCVTGPDEPENARDTA